MHKKSGFTLVELSIVLVILGLLVGGVLTGQSLIHAAELRSITTQVNNYTTAVQAFEDKYYAIPGDFAAAQNFWGIQNATPATCASSPSTDTKTCNGDGNGKLDFSAGSNEPLRFWQQLSNAGLIEGSYNGANLPGPQYWYDKTNAPAGRITGTLWSATYVGKFTNFVNEAGMHDELLFNGSYGNSFAIGGSRVYSFPNTSIFKPEDVYNIDMKMDDGKPATGSVSAMADHDNVFTNCTTTGLPSNMTADYNLANATVACSIIFRNAF